MTDLWFPWHVKKAYSWGSYLKMKSSGINLHVKALFILKSATRRLKSYFLLNKIHKTFTRHQVVHFSFTVQLFSARLQSVYSVTVGCRRFGETFRQRRLYLI